MCRSQQVIENIENSTSSEDEECNVIQSFDSCDDFEFLSIKYDFISIAQIEKYVENRIEIKQAKPSSVTENSYVKKSDIRRNDRSQQIKSLKASVRIDNQIKNITIDTCSLVSFPNWATAKQIVEVAKNTKFTLMEKQKL